MSIARGKAGHVVTPISSCRRGLRFVAPFSLGAQLERLSTGNSQNVSSGRTICVGIYMAMGTTSTSSRKSATWTPAHSERTAVPLRTAKARPGELPLAMALDMKKCNLCCPSGVRRSWPAPTGCGRRAAQRLAPIPQPRPLFPFSQNPLRVSPVIGLLMIPLVSHCYLPHGEDLYRGSP